jgi:hypothetical protein
MGAVKEAVEQLTDEGWLAPTFDPDQGRPT